MGNTAPRLVPASGEARDDAVAEAPRREGLWFTVLGPVHCWRDGVEVELGSPAQRALMAVDVDNASVIAREAIFDPVVTITRYDDVDPPR